MYPIFHVGFICKGFEREREREREREKEYVDLRQLKIKVVFMGISRVSFP